MLRAIPVAVLLALAAAAQGPPRPADAPERVTDPPDRMICKRFVETGSLVKGYRTCKTKRDWERERDALRRMNTGSDCNAANQPGGACR